MTKNSLIRKVLSVLGLLAFVVLWTTFRVVVFDSHGKMSFIDYIVLAVALLFAREFFFRKDETSA